MTADDWAQVGVALGLTEEASVIRVDGLRARLPEAVMGAARSAPSEFRDGAVRIAEAAAQQAHLRPPTLPRAPRGRRL